MNDQIHEKGVCVRILFNKESFTIAIFKLNSGMNVTVKGNFFVKTGNEYMISADRDDSNSKYPNTYNATKVKYDIDLNNCSKKQLEKFLSNIVSDRLAYKIVNTLDDPVKAIESNNVDELKKVDGLGDSRINNLIDGFLSQRGISDALVYFQKYNLSTTNVKKIIKYYQAQELAISEIERDPYNMTNIGGIGFKTADAAFLYMCRETGSSTTDIRRTQAYIKYLFDEEYSNGNTWVNSKQFAQKIIDNLNGVSVKDAIEYVKDSPLYVVIQNTDENLGYVGIRISSKSNLMIEMEIASIMSDLNSRDTSFNFKDVEDIIKQTEEEQGWEYSDEQTSAIHDMLNKSTVLIQGKAGTGKSSVVSAFTKILRNNHYSFAQCALSGKAANNLSLITHEKGSTIHSLIGYNQKEPNNEQNPLPYSVVILDEVSMVDSKIFLSLLKAIPKDGKLIMLGDSGQLDSIGAGVMNGIIQSKSVPSSNLTKIFRQAQNSAIITHSSYFREGKLPPELKVTPNTTKVYGNNQDFEYIFVKTADEKDLLLKSAMVRFKECIAKYGSDGVQIICSTKKTGSVSTFKLNYYAQMIANPSADDKEEFLVGDEKDGYVLRVGDKVINMTNDKSTISPKGASRPIFNGNTGKLLAINGDNMIIDFDGIGEVVVSKTSAKNIMLGYAATTHKMQGSTIPCVIDVMPYHFLLNSRELLYTGTTRSAQYQILVTSPRTLRDALKKTSKRTEQTNLSLFLKDLEYWENELNIHI